MLILPAGHVAGEHGMMRWGAGPRTRGCIYHEQGIYRQGADSFVADVFIMPKIARQRPIAVTVGRYRNFKPIAKRKWQLRDPEAATRATDALITLFEEVGAPTLIARKLGTEVCLFLNQEAQALKRALSGLPAGSSDGATMSLDKKS